MKRAIISDIHGNIEALEAVLSHLRQHGPDEIICLGDIIGYGPDPIACLDRVIDVSNLTILGNHDQAALFDPNGFNPVALRAIYWTRDQLEKDHRDVEQSNRRWDFLGELPRRHDEGEMLFVHGSPRDPTNEYVFPEYIYDRDKMAALMQRFEKYCFQGHTHIPGVFTESGSFFTPDDIGHVFQLNSDKVMVNVGSVGQPRDEDPRACYVILDTDARTVTFYRVEYDVAKTRNKILAIPELDNMLGERLMGGR
ncbi:MAG TPA: metallophosphoesterase family protein [Pirellulaceae bacterium]|nr:metallophosphoesterase family protein [Pirellulaceae bacterium]